MLLLQYYIADMEFVPSRGEDATLHWGIGICTVLCGIEDWHLYRDVCFRVVEFVPGLFPDKL